MFGVTRRIAWSSTEIRTTSGAPLGTTAHPRTSIQPANCWSGVGWSTVRSGGRESNHRSTGRRGIGRSYLAPLGSAPSRPASASILWAHAAPAAPSTSGPTVRPAGSAPRQRTSRRSRRTCPTAPDPRGAAVVVSCGQYRTLRCRGPRSTTHAPPSSVRRCAEARRLAASPGVGAHACHRRVTLPLDFVEPRPESSSVAMARHVF